MLTQKLIGQLHLILITKSGPLGNGEGTTSILP